MGTNTGTIMTLANSIIGVSVLAMPFCFKQCGIILSIVMLLASSYVSRLACHFLLKAAIMARRRNFEILAFHTFGSTGKFAAELFIIGFLLGTCIAFFVVVGDLGPAIVAKTLRISNTATLRPSVLIGLAVFVVLPLGLLRNVDSLTTVCMATIGFYGCLVLKVLAEAMPHLMAADWLDKVHFWRPAGIMQCIPIFSMALFCQTQLFEIYESLHNASLDRMNDVIRAAVNICTGVYICVGFFGYVAYCTENFSGNVLMSFTPTMWSELIKLGFVLSVAVSFPLVIFPCRASLYSLLFRRIAVPYHEGLSHIPEARFKCLTVFIISVALAIGLLIPNIELVLGLVGSTIGVLICVMFPAAAFICISTKSSNERLLAQVVLFVGALILVLGTYATLHAVNEVTPETENTSTHVNLPNKEGNNQIDLLSKHSIQNEKAESNVKMKDGTAESKENVAAPGLDVNALPKIQQRESINVDVDKGKTRQEPPVPVEPGQNLQSVSQKPAVPIEVVQDKKDSVQGSEKREDRLNSEQVNQDAIKKEDEELAEAEKQTKAEAEKKNAELLRKLEKHEEEQIKLLQEQKQILQALQEHKKERDRKKEDGRLKENDKNNLHQEAISDSLKQKSIDINLGLKKNVDQSDTIKKPVVTVHSLVYQERLNNIVNNKVSSTATPEVKKISNIINIINNNNINVQSTQNPKLQQPLNGADVGLHEPNILLERLKSVPLSLDVKDETLPVVIAANKETNVVNRDTGDDSKVMRREILQDQTNTVEKKKVSDIEGRNMSGDGILVPSGVRPVESKSFHEREKRGVEEETVKVNETSIRIMGEPHKAVSEKEVINVLDNCAHTDNPSSSNKESDHISNNGNVISNLVEQIKSDHNDSNYNQMDKLDLVNTKTANNETISVTAHKLSKQPENKNITEAKMGSQNYEVTKNSNTVLQVNSQVGESRKSNDVDTPQRQFIVREQKVESVGSLIMTATHLSQPEVEQQGGEGLNDGRQQTFQEVASAAKPMKRDLKSISIQQTDKPAKEND